MRFTQYRRRILSFLTIALLSTPITMATADKEGEKTGDNGLTITDVLHRERARSFNFSPDVRWVVWTKTAANKKENKTISHIFLTSLTDSLTIQITQGSKGASSPKFSPDGSKIAYLSSQGKNKTQIFVYPITGGIPKKVSSAIVVATKSMCMRRIQPSSD